MQTTLGLSITLSGLSRLYSDDLAGVVETARIADELGIDQIAVPDHVVMGANLEAYPYGRFPFPVEEPWLEPIVALGAIAGATRRIRLATNVLIAPLRSAPLLAKSVATLDALSNGRVDLGVGSGWQMEEYLATGVPFVDRSSRLYDVLCACRVLWREAPASFRSETVEFDEVWCLPRPVQAGGIPIFVGAALGATAVERMIRLDAGWMPITSSLDEISDGVGLLQRARKLAGLEPARPRVRANVPLVAGANGRPDLERILGDLPALAEAGATTAAFPLAAFAREPAEIRPFLERLARRAR